MARTLWRWKWGFGSLAVLMILLVALNWQGLALGVGMSASEKRPALLDDAGWDQPNSAQKFQNRFGPGTSERHLIEWLRQNHFDLSVTRRTASRRIEGLPCNELVAIDWAATNDAAIKNASATVHEAGCL